MVKGFNEWIAEAKQMDPIKMDVSLEFDWTWADQMSKKEATAALMDEFKDLPEGVKLVGKPSLDGFSGRRGDYGKEYTAEFTLEATIPATKVKKWCKDIQLGTCRFN